MSSHKSSSTNLSVEHPDIYRLTPEEARAGLEKIFTPEELADFVTVDVSNLPQGKKSLSEMVNEDREDRV